MKKLSLWIAEKRRDHKHMLNMALTRLRRNYRFYTLLQKAGLAQYQNDEPYGLTYVTMEVTVDDLRTIRRVLGEPLTVWSKEAIDESTVNVKLHPASDKGGDFIFIIKKSLPQNAKCRVVKQTSEYLSLVCED